MFSLNCKNLERNVHDLKAPLHITDVDYCTWISGMEFGLIRMSALAWFMNGFECPISGFHIYTIKYPEVESYIFCFPYPTFLTSNVQSLNATSSTINIPTSNPNFSSQISRTQNLLLCLDRSQSKAKESVFRPPLSKLLISQFQVWNFRIFMSLPLVQNCWILKFQRELGSEDFLISS